MLGILLLVNEFLNSDSCFIKILIINGSIKDQMNDMIERSSLSIKITYLVYTALKNLFDSRLGQGTLLSTILGSVLKLGANFFTIVTEPGSVLVGFLRASVRLSFSLVPVTVFTIGALKPLAGYG